MDNIFSVEKDPARARLSGGFFELRLAGLLSVRLRAERRRRPELNLQFLVATNMDGANPFDDVVLRIAWDESGRQRVVTYFFQLKHAEKVDKPVPAHDLTAANITKKNKDFNLRKYFKFHQRLKELKESSGDDLKGNEKLLRDWGQGECRFVLFTTREVLPKSREKRAVSLQDFPFDDIFSTDQGQAFSFGETDKEVWGMFAGDGDETVFRSEFLPRLRVFSAQAQASALEPMLLRALEDALNGLPPLPDQLLSKYTTFLQQWWDSNDGSCLSELTTEIEDIIRDDIHAKLHQLSFREEFSNSLSLRVRDCCAAFIVIPGISQERRGSLIRSVLTKTHTDRFIIMTDAIVKDYPHEALFAICSKLCDEVVLCTDTRNNSLLAFVDRITSSGSKNLRVMSLEWDKEMFLVMKSQFHSVSAWTERWTLDRLDPNDQQTFLEKHVCFQGHIITLAELENVWPNLRHGIGDAALEALANGKTFTIGLPLKTVEDSYYVPRTVHHAVTLNRSILKLRSAKDHFFLSGFPEQILKELRQPDSDWEECSLNGVPVTREKVQAFDPRASEKEPKTHWTELCSDAPGDSGEQRLAANVKKNRKYESEYFSGKRINRKIKLAVKKSKPQEEVDSQLNSENRNRHWILFENNEFIWKKSEGETDNLTNYIKSKSSTCQRKPVCNHRDNRDFLSWADSTFILTDSAGMGKSTFLTHISNVIKDTNESEWVIVVRINDGQIIDELPEEIKGSHVHSVLKKYAGIGQSISDRSASIFLRDCIDQTGHLTVLVDGVDEVCPSHKVKVLKFLVLLQEILEKNGGHLWIASRTVLKHDLSKITPNSTCISLSYFSLLEQVGYLRNRWSDGIYDGTESHIDYHVSYLVDVVRKATSTGDRSLCDVPLYTRMLADAYTKDDLDQLLEQTDEEKNSRLNKAALYKRFIEKTLGVVWAKVGISESAQVNLNITSEDVLKKHGVFAAFECFRGSEFLGEHFDDVLQVMNELKDGQEREKIARAGIITHIVDGRPKFLHYTLAEYLAAMWLLDKHSSLPKLTRSLYEGVFGEVRYFFDALLAEDSPLHTAAINGHEEALLSALRLKGQGHCVELEDKGGRRALHLAVIGGNVDTTKILLEKGAKVSVRDRILGWTPLRYFDTITNRILAEVEEIMVHSIPLLEIVEILLKASAKIEDAPILLDKKDIFLQIAIRDDYPCLTKSLIKKSVWLIFQKWQKKPYLHVAAQHGSWEVLHMLQRLGFQVNATSLEHSGGTPLHLAAAKGHLEICKFLLSCGAKVGARDAVGYTPLHEAVIRNHQSVCEVSWRKKGTLQNKAE
ncbi:Uncharacterized protein GBIM_01684 [Gryllus bimaculatus]|nr:Uncharacterized protein GBIM_01684 [Gryllus bimaculatus]